MHIWGEYNLGELLDLGVFEKNEWTLNERFEWSLNES